MGKQGGARTPSVDFKTSHFKADLKNSQFPQKINEISLTPRKRMIIHGGCHDVYMCVVCTNSFRSKHMFVSA